MGRTGAGGSPLCACGCGEPVRLKARHRTEGPPRYLYGHHPNPIRRAYEKLRRDGYRLIAEACPELGVSPTTLRRLEAAGVLPKVQRIELLKGRSVRVFTPRDLKHARVVMERRRETFALFERVNTECLRLGLSTHEAVGVHHDTRKYALDGQGHREPDSRDSSTTASPSRHIPRGDAPTGRAP